MRIGTKDTFVQFTWRACYDTIDPLPPSAPGWGSSALYARRAEADAIRNSPHSQNDDNRVVQSLPMGAELTESENEKKQRQLVERKRKNRAYNRKITGWHLGNCVLYPFTKYPGVKSLVFRTSLFEYSVSFISKERGRWSGNDKDLSGAFSVRNRHDADVESWIQGKRAPWHPKDPAA